MAQNPLIPRKAKDGDNFSNPEKQSMGILDDYSVRKVTANQVTYTSQIRMTPKTESDKYIYFYEGGSETGAYIKWQDSPARFIFSNLLQAAEGIISDGYVQASTNLISNTDVYVNYNGADGDSYVYFYEGSSTTGRYLKWDDSSNQFEFNDIVQADGFLVTANNSTVDTAYVPMILYNTDATPPAAAGFPVGTLYFMYTP